VSAHHQTVVVLNAGARRANETICAHRNQLNQLGEIASESRQAIDLCRRPMNCQSSGYDGMYVKKLSELMETESV